MKKINVGLLAHVDAGKTTLTEQLLYRSGTKRTLGKVDEGTSTTDFLSVERRRGISVKASSVTISAGEAQINLIDTPGHIDFISEVERALSALDVAVLVVSAVEGVQAQTRTLLTALQRMRLPAIVFINKLDRAGASYEKTLSSLKGSADVVFFDAKADSYEEELCECISAFDESVLESFLEGNETKESLEEKLIPFLLSGAIYPVLSGSGKTGEGVNTLLNTIASFPVKEPETDELSAVVYKLEHDKTLGRVAHIRLFSGQIAGRDEVEVNGTVQKITQIKRIQGGKYTDVPKAEAGDVCAVCGIECKAGDFIGQENGRICKMNPPLFTVSVATDDEKRSALLKAMEELTEEDPSLSKEWIPEKRELVIHTTGKIQLETLSERILEKYGIPVTFSKPSVIYKETPKASGYGFECYTMPKPCWAVVHLRIDPLPRGSGILFESTVSDKDIHYKYQEHVRISVLDSVKQGLYGWEVTDCKFTLVGGEDHVQHTHPLDFFVATPMAVMDGLRNCGVTLLEPIVSVTFTLPVPLAGKLETMLIDKKATVLSRESLQEQLVVKAELSARETFTLYEEFAMLTGGKGTSETSFSHYAPVREIVVRERVGINPLDRSKWILHARQAL
ncbi:MAG: TetM/TetW/TetO/TetS family tetracycline resistance ribosomal protection protein [Clostridia bacterium]|nr:TetM/TetW/TetO/TetS family tetracycline resistance ribosomal protection protein [Clostridia bacterium]